MPGIGEVTERLLQSVGVNVVKDFLSCRDALNRLFPQAEFFFEVALGTARMKETKQTKGSVSKCFTT